jgi:hypothetical protein
LFQSILDPCVNSEPHGHLGACGRGRIRALVVEQHPAWRSIDAVESTPGYRCSLALPVTMDALLAAPERHRAASAPSAPRCCAARRTERGTRSRLEIHGSTRACLA